MKLLLLLLFPLSVFCQSYHLSPVASKHTRGAAATFVSCEGDWKLRFSGGVEIISATESRTLIAATFGLRVIPMENISPVFIWNNGLAWKYRFTEGGAGVKVGRVQLAATYRVHSVDYTDLDGWVGRVSVDL